MHAAADADFETSVERVEQIIERLESGQVGLEESITQYEQGVELLRQCREMLERAEQRVTELTARMHTEPPAAGPATRAATSSKRSKSTGRAADKPPPVDEPGASDPDEPAPF